ncbi:WecB/TagA/CpsF family glycosyltransferase [Nesterenkonia sp. Act20]|uniref:WecB/TagA/CpsF family glycosyltransferase n=1 Tax=Nesterenkonia sp. Act20 TaxID=1483432 RepID=UPI001C466EB8|nr:WecB/TagA/CpsF family glycosyltransferase [Nesterenkonia sp. Act20]
MTVIPTVKVPLLGVRVSPLRRQELLRHIHRAVLERRRLVVAGHNLHSVYLWHHLAEVRDFYAHAGAVIIDGMPLLALLRFWPARSHRRAAAQPEMADGAPPHAVAKLDPPALWSAQHRLGSTDWLDGLTTLAGITRVTALGGTTEAAAAAQKYFESLNGDVSWQSIPADPWCDKDLALVIEQIRAHDPQVLLIGMGMPLQERIADELSHLLDVPVIATVGGALDQLGGVQSLAPRQVGAWGFEWLWRLASDPRRLSGRYLLEPIKLAALLVRRTR